MITKHKHAVLVTIVIVTITILGIVTISQSISVTSQTTFHSTEIMLSTITGYFGYTTTVKNTIVTTTTITSSTKYGTTTTKSSVSTDSTLSSSPSDDESFITESAPQSSQWLVIRETIFPTQVSANNTGIIPPYSNLASLNQTTIGEVCTQIVDSSCQTWKFVSQTGWFFDSVNFLLYVHYQGAPAVQIILTY